MVTRGKLILMVFAALLIAFGVGFGWGASGKIGLQTAVDESKLQLDVVDARAQLLDARVSLYNNNFGDANKHLEDSKPPLGRVKARYQAASRSDAASRIDTALARVDEAQRLAVKLDQSANGKAGDALDAIKMAIAQ
jgi:hypothetical protein